MFNRFPFEKCYRKFYFQDSFYAQCLDVNPLTMEQFDISVEQIKGIIDHPKFKTVNHIIGTGCGDSNLAAFAIKEAYEHYLPNVEYEAVESIELGRHYDFAEDESNTMALYISVSGSINRTIEAMYQCKNHGITNVGITDNPNSGIAKNSDILCWTNSPKGDNNAGLRTYYCNMITAIILAAAIAEVQTGNSYIPELREQVQKYHDAFFAKFEAMDETVFRKAIHWMDKKYMEIVGDGPMFWAGKFVQAKVIELSGDACHCIDSENFKHVNQFMYPGEDWADMVILNTNDTNVPKMVESINKMVECKRDVILFCDKAPEEIGVVGDVTFCEMPVPEKEWNFLAPIYAYLPGSVLAGFRHTTIGEPMFRGGFDQRIFMPSYFSPIDVVEL